jgi:hypothetical protein
MTVNPIIAKWLLGENSDALRRNLERPSSRVTSKFRDGVSEIYGRCSGLLAIQHALRVEFGGFDFNSTIRKFRTVARQGAWRLESLVAQRKTLATIQPASKNKKGAA